MNTMTVGKTKRISQWHKCENWTVDIIRITELVMQVCQRPKLNICLIVHIDYCFIFLTTNSCKVCMYIQMLYIWKTKHGKGGKFSSYKFYSL